MAPRPHLLKDQPSKLKRLQNAKNKKKPAGRYAPSRTVRLCGCQAWLAPPTLPPKKPDPVRRNPGRMDGVRWAGSSFICPTSVEGDLTTSDNITGFYDNDYLSLQDDIWDQAQAEASGYRREDKMSVQLWDIARPAKVKGIAKEFEVVHGVRRTIVLEDDNFETIDEEDEDWENIYVDKMGPEEPRTYSAVLRGNEH